MNRLKEVREARGLTQADVAKAVGISLRVYRYYESHMREPSISIALRLAETLKTPVHRLFDISDRPTR